MIAIFAVAFLLGLAISWYVFDTIFTVQAVEWFVALSMSFLAVAEAAGSAQLLDHVPEL